MIQLSPITKPIHGEMTVPADKSISHRSVIIGSLAYGTTYINNFLFSEDCLHTVDALKKLGANIEQRGTSLKITSKGLSSLREPKHSLYFGNSGTTARLLLGVLAGLPFHTTVFGDEFLTKRPMERVVTPLRNMGASIDGSKQGTYLPLSILGEHLTGITYELPVKSAQVKSAILLAGLFAQNETTVIEQTKTRDHTEKMLRAFGAQLTIKKNQITLNRNELTGTTLTIPGDISSATFFLVAAAIVPNSQLTIRQIGLNDTRTGILDVMQEMGAQLTITNQTIKNNELIGDITIVQSKLHGTTIEGDIIPRLIDEIPMIALLATQAEGQTIIKDAKELRVKETDRIKAIVKTLKILGANIIEFDNGMMITGKTPLVGGEVSSFHDHRIAMMAVIASLIVEKTVTIDEIKSISVSFPNFLTHLNELIS